MKNCPSTTVLLSLIDGTLSSPVAQSVHAHVESCEGCQASHECLLQERQSRIQSGLQDIAGESSFIARMRELIPVDVVEESPANTLLTTGSFVGRYRIEECVGSGGMGTVYRATMTSEFGAERAVAIKLIRTSHSPERTKLLFEAIKQESRNLAGLEHRNVAAFIDAGFSEHGPYLVTEYIRGARSIVDYCDSPSPASDSAASRGLSLSERLALFQDVCTAVDWVHRIPLLHNDISSRNVLVDENGEIKVIDFGISQPVAQTSNDGFTVDVRSALSPDFASPERLVGQHVNVASDVYSLGVLLYQLLAGGRPYEIPRESQRLSILRLQQTDTQPRPLSDFFSTRGSDAHQTVEAIKRQAAIRQSSPKNLIRVLSGDLEAIAAMATQLDPSQRYQSVKEMSDDIDRFLHHFPISARDSSALYIARRLVRRWWVAILTCSIAFVILIGATLLERHWNSELERANEVATNATSLLVEGIDDVGQELEELSIDETVRLNLGRINIAALLQSLDGPAGHSRLSRLKMMVASGDYFLRKITVTSQSSPAPAVLSDGQLRTVLERHAFVSSSSHFKDEPDWPDASVPLTLYSRAMKVAEEIRGDHIEPSHESDKHICVCFTRLARVVYKYGDLEGARHLLQQATEAGERSVASSLTLPRDSRRYRRIVHECISAYDFLSAVANDLNDQDSLISASKRTLTLGDDLLPESLTPEQLRSRIDAYRALADMYVARNDHESAITYLDQAYRLQVDAWKSRGRLRLRTILATLPESQILQEAFGTSDGPTMDFDDDVTIGTIRGLAVAHQRKSVHSFYGVSALARKLASVHISSGFPAKGVRSMLEASSLVTGIYWSATVADERREAIKLLIHAHQLGRETNSLTEAIGEEIRDLLLRHLDEAMKGFTVSRVNQVKVLTKVAPVAEKVPELPAAKLNELASLIETSSVPADHSILKAIAYARIMAASLNEISRHFSVYGPKSQRHLVNSAIESFERLETIAPSDAEQLAVEPNVALFLKTHSFQK